MNNELSAGPCRLPDPINSKYVPSRISRKFFQDSDMLSDRFTLQKTDKPGRKRNFLEHIFEKFTHFLFSRR